MTGKRPAAYGGDEERYGPMREEPPTRDDIPEEAVRATAAQMARRKIATLKRSGTASPARRPQPGSTSPSKRPPPGLFGASTEPRRDPQQADSVFSTSVNFAFGQSQNQTPTNPVFGQGQNQTPANPVFGQSQNQTPANPVFGQSQNQTPANPVFGQSQNQTPANPVFGQSQSQTPANLVFGQSQNQNRNQSENQSQNQSQDQTPASLAFGQSQNQKPASLAFGQSHNQSQNQKPVSFAFGQSHNQKPASFAFGQSHNQKPASFAFGQSHNQSQSQTPASLAFGQSHNQSQTPASLAFGQSHNQSQNPTPVNAVFGQSQNQTPKPGPPFSFGLGASQLTSSSQSQTAAPKPPVFGAGQLFAKASETPAATTMAQTNSAQSQHNLVQSQRNPAQPQPTAGGQSLFGATLVPASTTGRNGSIFDNLPKKEFANGGKNLFSSLDRSQTYRGEENGENGQHASATPSFQPLGVGAQGAPQQTPVGQESAGQGSPAADVSMKTRQSGSGPAGPPRSLFDRIDKEEFLARTGQVHPDPVLPPAAASAQPEEKRAFAHLNDGLWTLLKCQSADADWTSILGFYALMAATIRADCASGAAPSVAAPPAPPAPASLAPPAPASAARTSGFVPTLVAQVPASSGDFLAAFVAKAKAAAQKQEEAPATSGAPAMSSHLDGFAQLAGSKRPGSGLESPKPVKSTKSSSSDDGKSDDDDDGDDDDDAAPAKAGAASSGLPKFEGFSNKGTSESGVESGKPVCGETPQTGLMFKGKSSTSSEQTAPRGGEDHTALLKAEREANDVLLQLAEAVTKKFEKKSSESTKPEWVHKGAGPIFVLKDKTSGKVRILQKVGLAKITMNYSPVKDGQYTIHPRKPNMVIGYFFDHIHCSPPKLDRFFITVDTPEEAIELSRVLTEGIPK